MCTNGGVQVVSVPGRFGLGVSVQGLSRFGPIKSRFGPHCIIMYNYMYYYLYCNVCLLLFSATAGIC